MKLRINNPKEFWLGAVYLLCGAYAMRLAADYPLGTAGRMGPGYFPTVIASLLILFGTISAVRSLVTSGDPIRIVAIKPLLLITAAVVAFGFLLNTAGLVIAMAVLILMSAAASQAFRFQWTATVGIIGLILFCSLIFVKALGVPMPLIGEWIAPLLAWLGA